jgi:hypothetical protein
MAATKKGRDPAPGPTAGARADEERATQKVTITNTYRNQPLLFHFLGGSVRLGPLEAQDVDRSLLRSPELAHLVLTGVVTVSGAAASAAGAEGDNALDEADVTPGDLAKASVTKPEEK